jgi:putative ABC transport system ATP-binding protein
VRTTRWGAQAHRGSAETNPATSATRAGIRSSLVPDTGDVAVRVAVIETRGLTRDYPMGRGVVRALDSVDLTVEEGEFTALVGTSGSGKTTLLSLLGCLDRPTGGSYRLAGVEVSTLDADRLAAVRNRRIGFVFQAFHLLEGLRADENVALPLRYGGVPRAERLARARRMLERVGLGDRVHHRPTELSGGQRQRVAVARALVTEPALLLADEPTGNLDRASGAAILELFRELHRDGRTLVLVTHDEQVAAVADRRVRLEDGRIVSDDGSPTGP